MRVLAVSDGQLSFEERPLPEPKSGEVRIAVRAIGVNHADLLQRVGKYPPPPGASDLLGLEVAGEVEEIGPDCSSVSRGDLVMALLPSGGYAEAVCVHESHLIPIPHNLTVEEAAAIPEAFLTAYQALFMIGEIAPDSYLLLHAAASGVGTAAIQLARAFDAKVIATTRSTDKTDAILSLGANHVIHPQEGHFAEKVLSATEGHGADLILDFVGAAYFEENMDAMAQGGALIFLATLGGPKPPVFDLRILMKKWATISGTTLRNRPDTYKAKLIAEFSRFALSRLEAKTLKPVVHTILPWEQGEEAHELLRQNAIIGKIVLTT